jgi:uncharacterized membrane protein
MRNALHDEWIGAMIIKSAGLLMLLLAIALMIVQIAVYGGRLPDSVASHFDGQGNADGSMSRTAFLTTYAATQVGLAGLMTLIAWVLPLFPVSMINIPHRDYWLDETRRASTLRISQSVLYLIAGLTGMLLVVVFELTFQANLRTDRQLNSSAFLVTMAVYVATVFGMCGWMIWRFGRLPRDA